MDLIHELSQGPFAFEMLCFTASYSILIDSTSEMQFARIGARFGVSALPIGLSLLYLTGSVMACDWSLIPVGIAGIFFALAMARREGFERARARRDNLMRRFFRK